MTVVVRDGHIQIERLELGPFGTNAYVIACARTGESALVDTPDEASRIGERLRGTNPKYILITHGHMDHLGALAELAPKLKVPVAAHSLDVKSLTWPAEVLLDDGDTIRFGDIELKVLHTPGHSPGSVCFLTGNYLIAGDTIFPGGPGKTSSPANFMQIVESISKKILVLPDDTEIYPGHGDPTVLKKAKEEFAAFSSRSHDPNLCGDVLWLSS